MSTYSDEPVLLMATAKSSWKLWVIIACALFIAGAIIYVPINKEHMGKRARYAERGSRQGALVRIEIDSQPHTLELTWFHNRFAPVLDPAPAEGITLSLSSRKGAETLIWNTELACFGPVAFEVNPYAHHKLSLRIEKTGVTLWQDTVWAYGIH